MTDNQNDLFGNCIVMQHVFNALHANCPEDVADEIRDLFDIEELDDGVYYLWNPSNEIYTDGEYVILEEKFPKTAAYLESRGIENCLIHM